MSIDADVLLLISLFDDTDQDVVQRAQNGLNDMLSRYESSREQVMLVLQDQSPRVKVGIIRAMSSYVSHSRAWVQQIVELLLGSRDPDVRDASAAALAGSTNAIEARTALITRMLDDPTPRVRGTCAQSLGNGADLPDIRAALMKASGDADVGVRRNAVSSFTDNRSFHRLDAETGVSMRLQVVPHGEPRTAALELLKAINAALDRLIDSGTLDDAQVEIIDNVVVPNVHALASLVTVTADSLEAARAGRTSGLQHVYGALGALASVVTIANGGPVTHQFVDGAQSGLSALGTLFEGLIN